MVFFLYGVNTFLLKRKLREIVDKYRSKYKSGFNFLKVEATEDGFSEMKNKIETVSMFAEKKLIIVENLLSAKKLIQEKFQKYFEEKNIFEKEETVLIVVERGLTDKKSKLFGLLFRKAFKKQEFSELPLAGVKKFIKEETEKFSIKITPEAIEKLIVFFGNDLWQISNELQKLSSYKENKEITKEDIDNLCVSNINLNIFETIEAISKKDKRKALKLVSEHVEKGENEMKILSMINYQFRNILKIKSLIEEKKSFFQIQKLTKLHPFVVKKTFPLAKNFSIDELKAIYKKILEVDFKIKTGKIEPKLAIEMFIEEICL